MQKWVVGHLMAAIQLTHERRKGSLRPGKGQFRLTRKVLQIYVGCLKTSTHLRATILGILVIPVISPGNTVFSSSPKKERNHLEK